MQTERPRFRQDLVAELIEDGAARFIDVADPDSGQLFRFFEVEYSLACAMDGERDVAGIVRWAEEELGLKPTPNEIRSVISTLGGLGYLDSGKAAAAAASETPAVAAAVAAAPIETPAPAAEAPTRPTPPPPTPRKGTPPAGVPARAAKPAEDDYLGGGVVAGSKRPSAPVADVELGTAGGRSAPVVEDLPRGDDMELGAPGGATAASAASRPTARSSDLELGASGASSFSTDLASDMAISKADVKEAVRASQVMKSVDVPPELAAELEDRPVVKAKQPEAQVAAPAAKQPEAKVDAKAAAKQPEAKVDGKAAAKQPEAKVDGKAAAKQPEAKPAAKQPEAKPAAKPEATKPTAPTAPSSGTSPILLVVLALVVLAAIGFAVWKFKFSKKAETTGQVQPAPTPTPVPTPPPAPPVETAKLATETAAPEEIKSAAAAQLATVIATDATVQAGDTIAKLVGHKPSSDKIAMYEKELALYKTQTADAEKARDAATTDAAKKPAETKLLGLAKVVADREAKLVAARTENDKFLVKAPAAGKVTTVAKANAKVTPTDIIATLQRDPILVATFKAAGEATVDAKVLLAVTGSDQKLSCTVVAAGGDGTKIACPAGSAPDGAEVTFAGLDPDAAKPAEPAPTDGAPAPADGSAAAPAPADGSAAAPTPTEEKAEAPVAPKAQAPRRARPRPPAPAPAAASKSELFPPAGSAAAPAPATPAAPAPTPTPAPAAPAPAPTPAPAGGQ